MMHGKIPWYQFHERAIGLAILLALMILRIFDPLPVQLVRYQNFDTYQRLFPRQYKVQPIRIVDIDEASLARYGQWPWPRTTLAQLVSNIAAYGAITSAFDILFAEKDRLSPAAIAEDNAMLPAEIRSALAQLPSNDVIFADSLGKTRTVLGQSSVRQASDLAVAPPDKTKTPIALIGPDPTQFLQRFPALIANLPELEAAAAGRGLISLAPEADGIYRRVPLVMMVGGKIKTALSTEVLRIATGGNVVAIRSNDAGISGVLIGRQFVKTDSNAQVWPHYSHSEPRRFISAAKILDGTAPAQQIANHMVIIGTSAIGLEDYRPTPLGVSMSGVEIHTQVIESILSNQLLWRPNYALGMELAFILLVGLMVIYLIPKFGAMKLLILTLLLMAGFSGGSLYAFLHFNMLFDATFPIVSMAFLIGVMATSNYFREERQRKTIRGAFSQYISPELVKKLIDQPELMVLGGETRTLTVLFSDVRGFTTLSETFIDNPQGLTELMNEFMTELSDPILKHNGTIDKYMGDSVMAFWNAPIDLEDHAIEGCRAALDMINRIDLLNAKRAEEAKKPNSEAIPIRVGIGINTGTCVVGNMGSEQHFDYTALGDTVNLASRLEGQSKPYGLPIVIGDTTASMVAGELATIEIDLIRVKGKEAPERMFALLGDSSLFNSDAFINFRDRNAEMIAAYRSKDWVLCEQILRAMHFIDMGGIQIGSYVGFYEERIKELRLNPPNADWDGVHIAQSK